jgi:hypothetical protein
VVFCAISVNSTQLFNKSHKFTMNGAQIFV